MNQLRIFGLGSIEEKVYLALLESGESTGAETARNAGIPTSKIYSALERLVRLQIVAASGDRRTVYKAVSLEIALETLTRLKEQELISQRKEVLANIRTKITTSAKPDSKNVEIFFNRDNRYELLIKKIEGCKREILVYSSGLTNKVAVVRAILSAKKQGVKVKFLAYDTPSPLLKRIEVRKCEALQDYSFLVMDSQDVLQVVKNSSDRTKDVNLLIENVGLAKVFRDYFYSKWG